MPTFTESVVEQAALAWLESVGWQVGSAAENVTIRSVFQQLQTYQAEVPTLFATKALLAVSDAVEARLGTRGAGRERSVITKHIRNVFAEGELDEKCNVQNLHILPPTVKGAGLPRPDILEVPGAVVVRFCRKETSEGSAPEGTVGITPLKTPDAILRLLKEDPELSFPDLASRLGKSESAVKRTVRRLRESGRLERVGPDKGGGWKVNE